MVHLQELKVKFCPMLLPLRLKIRTLRTALGLKGAWEATQDVLSATDVHPGLNTAAGRDVASPRQSVLLLNYPEYWKYFPNICPKASLNASPISSFPCPLLLHLQPKSGPPQTCRKGIGRQHKARAMLGFMCLPCLDRSFCVQPKPAEFNWKSNSFYLFNAWMSECCFLGFGPSCCLCWVTEMSLTPVLFISKE